MDITVSRREKVAAHATDLQEENLQVGELLVAYLESLGVEYVYGVPGGAVEPFYNAMARSERRGGLSVIGARNESGAAYIAQGYYQASGKLGVCVATTGPGATNLISGVASAFLDEVPLLVITGMGSPTTNGKAAFQDSSPGGVDTFSLMQHCTRYSALITHPEQFEREFYTALKLAFGEQPGPVHLCIPVDVLSGHTGLAMPSFNINDLHSYAHPIDKVAIEKLLTLFQQKPKAALVIGEYCSDSAHILIEFAQHLQIPFVTLPGAKGFVDPTHPLYRGVFGFAGHFSARETLIHPDIEYIVVAGSALSEWDTAKWDSQAIFNQRLIHIDPVVHHLAYTPMAHLHIRSDVGEAFKYLLKALPPANVANGPTKSSFVSSSTPAARHQLTHSPINPALLMTELSKAMPMDVRYFIDAGNSMSWGLHFLHAHQGKPANLKSWFHISMRFAAMGWGIGNAIGAAIGNRNSPVVCITGDGSLLMNGQEFTVALSERLPVIFVVLNDSSLGMVKHGQRLAGAEPVSFTLPTINFAQYAQSMGGNGIRCHSLSDFQKIDFSELFRHNIPTLIDVEIDAEAPPPMHGQVKQTGGMSYVR